MPAQFTLEYAVFVFLGAVGALQIVSGRNQLYRLLLVKGSPRGSTVLGLVLIAASIVWFFASADRNIPDTAGGLDGNAQARWFAVSAAVAVAVTVVLTSTVHGVGGRDPVDEAGLDALRRSSYLSLLRGRRRR